MEAIAAGDILILSAFAGFESLYTPSAMLPSIMTIGTFVDSPDKVKMIYQGMGVSAALNLAFGALLSFLSRSWLPFAFTIGATLIIMAVYWFALTQAPAVQG